MEIIRAYCLLKWVKKVTKKVMKKAMEKVMEKVMNIAMTKGMARGRGLKTLILLFYSLIGNSGGKKTNSRP